MKTSKLKWSNIYIYRQVNKYSLKRVHIRSFYWSVFYFIKAYYGGLTCTLPSSVRIWENTDKNNLNFEYFSIKGLSNEVNSTKIEKE